MARYNDLAKLFNLKRRNDAVSLILMFASGALMIHISHLKASLQEASYTASDMFEPTQAKVLKKSDNLTPIDSQQDNMPPPPNNTAKSPQQDLLVFTKINRCGSTAMENLLRLLSRKNRYGFWVESKRGLKSILPKSMEDARKIVRQMNNVTRPAVISKSVSYIDFNVADFGNPIYISMVRDPIEQASSWFHWMRAPFAVVERILNEGNPENAARFLPKAAYLKKSFAKCIESDDAECDYPSGAPRLNHPIRAFCTESPACPVFGDREALAVAKRTVERHYAVVGVLEHWDISMKVMEKSAPFFFEGASRLYADKIAHNKTLKDENFYRPKMKSNQRSRLEEMFQVELEFYQFIKQRLFSQYAQIHTAA